MKAQILGAHNAVSSSTGYTSVLIDDTLAVDAGSLSAQLSFEAQRKLKAILLTHAHYDHLRDIPSIGMSMNMMKMSLDVYAAASVGEALSTYLNNDKIYLDFTKKPPENPALRVHTIEPRKKETVAGYEVLPVALTHSVPATGYQITSSDGKKVFITSDTGPGLADAWRQISPDLLITELTVPNRHEEFARKSGHLTPALLQKELESFLSINGYLPRVALMHLNPFDEKDIKTELRMVEKTLKIEITISHEGMTLTV